MPLWLQGKLTTSTQLSCISCKVFVLCSQPIVCRPWATEQLREAGEFHRNLRRLWFDTHVHDDGAFQLLRQHVGDQHLIFGTNFAGWDQAEGADPPQVQDVDLVGNARRLLRV